MRTEDHRASGPSPRPGSQFTLRSTNWHLAPVRLPGLWLLIALLIVATPISAGNRLTATPAPVAVVAATWSDFAPVAWVVAIPATATVTVQAPGGLDPATAAYTISADGGANWSSWSTAGLTVGGAISATQMLTVTGLVFGDSATANQIRFRIQELGAALETSPAYTVRADATAPVSVIASPAQNAALNAGPTIQGTATDGVSGVNRAAVSIRSTTTGLYWNGAAWTGGEQWLDANGAASWTYAGVAPAWTDGSYVIRSRATDVAGNTETPGAGVTFTFDSTPPTVTVLKPNGGEVWASGRPYSITWSAADAGGLAASPITISVSYNSGADWMPLAAGVPNSGSYGWTPPAVNSIQVLIEVEAIDRAGNRGADRSNAAFTVSAAAPGAPQNLQASPVNWTNLASFALSWTNPPELATITGAWYKLDQPPTTQTDGIFVPTAAPYIAGIAPTDDGAHPVYVWLQDMFGRADHTRTASTILYLDRTSPSPPSGLQGNPARTWTNVNRFSERWTNPPDLSGIVGVYYRINRPGLYPTDGVFVSISDSPRPPTGTLTDIIVPADGKHDLYLWLVDAAGNADHNNRNVDPQVFWYDGTPPVSSLQLSPPLPASGWYSTAVSASFSATDGPGGSGVDVVWNRVGANPWTVFPSVQIANEGLHVLDYYAQDVAGNLEPTRTITIGLDFTPPAVALLAERPPPASGWYTAAVRFTLALSDTLSGNPVGYYRLNNAAWQTASQFQLPADGVYQIDFYGEDAAGNRSATGSAQARLDVTPPATAYLVEGAQGQNGWFVSPLTIRLIATDTGSGVAATHYRLNDGPWQSGAQVQLTADGLYTLDFYSVDLAGNVERSFPVQIRLDKAAPVAPTAVETTPTAWTRTNRFGVQWANPTDLSGIAGVFYRLNQTPAAPDDGVFSPVTNRLDNLTVPAEGVHRLYLWLRDSAGNADQRNHALAPLLRYDATPPTTTLRIQGTAGVDGWYRSAVTLTLEPADLHSGVAATRYRLDAGDWVTGTSLTLTAPDKYVFAYASEDVAGNVEPVRQTTVRIDLQPPAVPQRLAAEPGGWQHYNNFRLTWRNPLDQSGIAGAYVRFGAGPAHASDGVFYPASEILEGVQVPAEGQHHLFVWLRDRAGNSDHLTAVALPSALWYDGTPPTTIVTLTGSAGQNDWYCSAVTFTMSAADAASGVEAISWQVNGGAWNAGESFSLNADGLHTVQIAARDRAGNAEQPRLLTIAIDRQPPLARMSALSKYSTAPNFTVRWSGSDLSPGSGLASFDVQVRTGLQGAWEDWLVDTTLTQAVFGGQRGHAYYFRVRARDVAGNQAGYSAGDAYTVIETVRNGSFDTGNFSEWGTSGLLRKAVVPTNGPGGYTVLAARLGTPEYGPSIEEPGQVPVGSATLSQTVVVPGLAHVAQPTLTFWYRVFSYDVVFSQRLQRYVDAFEVTILDEKGQQLALLLRDGNTTNQYGALHDTGWKLAMLDLRPYASQTVQLEFSNWNREDNLFNTWSFVDGIQVQDWPYNERRYLPIITRSGSQTAAGQSVPESPVVESSAPQGKR